MCWNHRSSRDACFWTPEFDQTSVFLWCCDWHCFFSPPSNILWVTFEHLLWALTEKKSPQRNTNVTIKGSWCLDCTPGVLTAEQHRATLARCIFTILPVSLALSSLSFIAPPATTTISHHLFFLAVHLSLLSSFALCSNTPCDSCTNSGLAIRPISPISWCWVGTMRNGLVAMQVASTDVRCVWAAMTVMSVCSLMDGREECVVRGTEW